MKNIERIIPWWAHRRTQVCYSSTSSSPSIHQTLNYYLQKFSDDTATVRYVSEGNNLEYREVIKDFVGKFQRKMSQITPGLNIQGLDIEATKSYKYLGVHLNNRGQMSSSTTEETEERRVKWGEWREESEERRVKRGEWREETEERRVKRGV